MRPKPSVSAISIYLFHLTYFLGQLSEEGQIQINLTETLLRGKQIQLFTAAQHKM